MTKWTGTAHYSTHPIHEPITRGIEEEECFLSLCRITERVSVQVNHSLGQQRLNQSGKTRESGTYAHWALVFIAQLIQAMSW